MLFFYQDSLITDSHIARFRINGYINNVHPIINSAFYNETGLYKDADGASRRSEPTDLSTSMVPCQRRDWWAEEMRRCCALFWKLPREVFDAIVDRVDEDAYPISREEGERMREEFREERDQFRRKHTEAMERYEEWDFWGEPGVGDGDGGHSDS